MNIYNLHKNEFMDYFANGTIMKDKICHINGNGCVNDIKTNIWAHLSHL